jgi:hypothetical protein
VDSDVNKSPAATELKSGVNLRNANHAPVVSLSCRAQNGHALCDASNSYDADGDEVTYQWQYTPCLQYTGSVPPSTCPWVPGQTSSTFDTGPGLTSGATETMIVEVTDAKGTFTDATYNLTMP